MTDKVNGRPFDGEWFERDLTWMRVVTNTTETPLFDKADELPPSSGNFFFGVDGWTDKVIRVLETRGTVLGFELVGALGITASDSLDVLIGSSGGAFDGSAEDVTAELEAEIDAMLVAEGVTVSTATAITVGKMSVTIA